MMPRSGAVWGVSLLVLVHAGCRGAADRDAASAGNTADSPAPETTAGVGSGRAVPVAAMFRNVRLLIDDTLILDVARLDGALVSTVPGRPPVFDDQRSFLLRIDTGMVSMSGASISHLMNRYVFAYRDSPISDLEISFEEGRLKQKGKLSSGPGLPFTIVADASVTDDGRLRLHPTSVKVLGVPAGALMSMLGLELADIIRMHRETGVQVVENDILLEFNNLMPAPAIDGRLTSVRIEGDRMIQFFGGRPASTTARPRRDFGNFIAYRGGRLQFGKLTMDDVDMVLIDAAPGDPFDFSPPKYIEQLVAGYSKNTRSGGLEVYMPDYDEARVDLRPEPRPERDGAEGDRLPRAPLPLDSVAIWARLIGRR